MTESRFPTIDPQALTTTRDAIHSYARIIGAWSASARKKRKHWWQASLRPSLRGLTTQVVYGGMDYVLEIDLRNSRLHVETVADHHHIPLTGQSPRELANTLNQTLKNVGVQQTPPDYSGLSEDKFADYSVTQAVLIHRAFAAVAASMEALRADMREEQSPIQIWPHHFDLSMIWLPGNKIAGQDPANEEYADKQMNFGFVLGDESVAEPYFYVTAYPSPEALAHIPLPNGTTWRTEGFNGAVTLYKDVQTSGDPAGYLDQLWHDLLRAGQEHVAVDDQ